MTGDQCRSVKAVQAKGTQTLKCEYYLGSHNSTGSVSDPNGSCVTSGALVCNNFPSLHNTRSVCGAEIVGFVTWTKAVKRHTLFVEWLLAEPLRNGTLYIVNLQILRRQHKTKRDGRMCTRNFTFEKDQYEHYGCCISTRLNPSDYRSGRTRARILESRAVMASTHGRE